MAERSALASTFTVKSLSARATATPTTGATTISTRAPLALHPATGQAVVKVRPNGQIKTLSCLFYVATSRAGQHVHVTWTTAAVEIIDLNGEVITIAKGGDGGFGNLRFKSAINRAPRQKTPGWPGDRKSLKLELKVLADVGLLSSGGVAGLAKRPKKAEEPGPPASPLTSRGQAAAS